MSKVITYVRHFKDNQVLEGNTGQLTQRDVFTSEQLSINWNELIFNQQEAILVEEDGAFLELHFQFNGCSRTAYQNNDCVLAPNSQTLFYVNGFSGKHELFKDNQQPFSCFEIKIDSEAIATFFPETLWHDLSFIKRLISGPTAFLGSIKPVTPQMSHVIYAICHCPFKGVVRTTYLEAKVVELFLLQAESHKPIQRIHYKKRDLDILIATKEYIDQHYLEKMRIIDLAKQVGTNQQLLKQGFKELYGTTIFGYYNDLRMERAKHLLLDKEKTVAEVADDIGYKNPQHFTVAFKKKYGTLPCTLKNK